ncbi:cell division protein FtsZ [Gammaproteobacteria bacterium]|nr:cell division protein FtsZ [Gammaproteobacteria bacterium]MDB9790705.1 cell division protein FtsZ [Gammaproteobacteria bacterium]MDC0091542.1 cell division protein FtsZ [Gammaproteobacteria bacterium]MDC1300885.1 cell division protein FtsZ [Gammaproteobacteria bacterium]MDC1525323.1 cell division protein FtsZ [Gammaproteobacteria bacterium]|tara:strand:+ start:543 stop:1670 length:1128 start_codon:yes stop_codon:yes gene_type:complete
MNWEIIEENAGLAKIKVIGVGGAGGNAVIHMMEHDIQGPDFICANTDAQALDRAQGATILKLGDNLTKGLGAGANPEIGRAAAERDRAAIEELLQGADMIFITAGMGGGTGTGAAPVIAQIAKELGALTVAVVTKPFNFEGKNRRKAAEAGIAELVEEVDSLITIPNEKLMEILGKKTTMKEAFAKADDILKGAVQGISDIIMKPGYVNVDFADVKTVMSEKGIAMMGTGKSSAENERGVEAAQQAVSSELLEDVELKDARGVLVNITAKGVTLSDNAEVESVIEGLIAEDATIIWGVVEDATMNEEELLVTVVATGINQRTATLAVDNTRRATVQLNPVGLNAHSARHIESGGTSSAEEIDFLDVPTFMRKQVD